MKERFTFGIYPGGLAGTETGLTSGPSDEPIEIEKALEQLQGDQTLLVRAYIGYKTREKISHVAPQDFGRYMGDGRPLDLVLCFQSEDSEMSGWIEFIQSTIRQYQDVLAKIQITEEANVDLPSLDGHYKHARRALVEGVVAAKREIHKLDLDVQVGFNATPDFNPDRTFWDEIASLGDAEFRSSVDYVGIDFFPDVFRPVARDGEPFDLAFSIRGVLTQFRSDLGRIGLPATSELHITENGWPTGPTRSEEQQAIMLEKIIRLIYGMRFEFLITHYELFSLRDADSNNPDLFYQFGILRDDYSRKEGFEVYRRLIGELG